MPLRKPQTGGSALADPEQSAPITRSAQRKVQTLRDSVMMRPVRGKPFALVSVDLPPFPGEGAGKCQHHVVGCGFWCSCVSAGWRCARYATMAMTFKPRFIL